MSDTFLPRTPVLAAIKKAEGPIPDLRPPRGHIAVDIPEAAILNGALLLAFAVLILGRIIHARRPLPPPLIEPPLSRARRALEAASGPGIVEDCAQIVRRYLANAFGIGPEGATARELCAAFAVHPLTDPDGLTALTHYLSESDLVLFAPHAAPEFAGTCASRTLALLEQIDARRLAAEPPPLPVAT